MAASSTTQLRITLPITDHQHLQDSIAVLESFTRGYQPQDVQEHLWRMLKESVGSEAGGDWFPEDRMRALDLYEDLCLLAPHLHFLFKCLKQMERE